MGHYCGYVTIPKTHPYDHSRKDGEEFGLNTHAYITWWTGSTFRFDCMHASRGDIVPCFFTESTVESLERDIIKHFTADWHLVFNQEHPPAFCTFKYAKEQVAKLAKQQCCISKINALKCYTTSSSFHIFKARGSSPTGKPSVACSKCCSHGLQQWFIHVLMTMLLHS